MSLAQVNDLASHAAAVYKACTRFVLKGAGLYFGDFSRGSQLKFPLFGVACKQCCL